MEGGEKNENRERAGCVPVSQILQRSELAPRGGSPGRLQSARDSPEPGSLSGLGLLRSLPTARSPPLSLPARQPARARAPAPPPPADAPTPTSREQETRGPAEGDQVGEAVLGEGTPRQPSSGLPNRCVDSSDASWAQPAPRIPRLGVI